MSPSAKGRSSTGELLSLLLRFSANRAAGVRYGLTRARKFL